MRHRSQRSPHERTIRSRLRSLLQEGPILRGTLTPLRNLCGKPNCKCVQGEKHESLYVAQSRDGRRHARCIPKAMRDEVSSWVTRYNKIQELVEKLSQEFWQVLDKRKPKP